MDCSDCSIKNFYSQKYLENVFEVLKDLDYQPRLLYPTKLSIKITKDKNFYNKNKIKGIYDHQASSTEGTRRNTLDLREG